MKHLRQFELQCPSWIQDVTKLKIRKQVHKEPSSGFSRGRGWWGRGVCVLGSWGGTGLICMDADRIIFTLQEYIFVSVDRSRAGFSQDSPCPGTETCPGHDTTVRRWNQTPERRDGGANEQVINVAPDIFWYQPCYKYIPLLKDLLNSNWTGSSRDVLPKGTIWQLNRSFFKFYSANQSFFYFVGW